MFTKIIEFLFPALREWRIGMEMEDGGEDAVADADRAWMEARNEAARKEAP